MSEHFEVKAIEGAAFPSSVNITPKDERWKNFGPCVYGVGYIENFYKMKEMKIYEDDVILCGYPRSGKFTR